MLTVTIHPARSAASAAELLLVKRIAATIEAEFPEATRSMPSPTGYYAKIEHEVTGDFFAYIEPISAIVRAIRSTAPGQTFINTFTVDVATAVADNRPLGDEHAAAGIQQSILMVFKMAELDVPVCVTSYHDFFRVVLSPQEENFDFSDIVRAFMWAAPMREALFAGCRDLHGISLDVDFM